MNVSEINLVPSKFVKVILQKNSSGTENIKRISQSTLIVLKCIEVLAFLKCLIITGHTFPETLISKFSLLQLHVKGGFVVGCSIRVISKYRLGKYTDPGKIGKENKIVSI